MSGEVTVARLRRLRPPGASVLLVGPEMAALEGELRSAGYDIERVERILPPVGGREVILAGESALVAPDALEKLHSGLRPDGLLLLPVRLAWGRERPEGSLVASDLIARLYEAGFALLDRVGLDAPLQRRETPPLHAEGPVRRELLVARHDANKVRSYRSGDETEILELFHAAFPHDRRSLEKWRWRYVEPGGPFLSLAMDAEERIATHHGAFPVPMVDATGANPHGFEAFQAGDTMTARGADRSGTRRTTSLARAIQHFYCRHCAHRVGFVYGFNAGRIHRHYLRHIPGTRLLEPAAYRVLELEAGRPRARGFWRRAVDGVRVERVVNPGPEFDELFRRVAPTYGLLAVRDAARLRWRYRDRPESDHFLLAVRRRGRLLGWGAFQRRNEVLVWGDALFDPRHGKLARELLMAALESDEGRGAKRIEGWYPDRPIFWDEVLRELGFERREDPEKLAFIFIEFEERDLQRRLSERLYYSRADSDLF